VGHCKESRVPWSRYVHGANARGIGAVRYPRLERATAVGSASPAP